MIRLVIVLVLLANVALGQTVNNSTTNKRYDVMPLGSAIWVTSTTFKTYIDDTKGKIDSLVSPQPYTKTFTNADSVVVLRDEHLIYAKVLNIVVRDSKNDVVLAPIKINQTTGRVSVKFHKKKTGTLFIY